MDDRVKWRPRINTIHVLPRDGPFSGSSEKRPYQLCFSRTAYNEIYVRHKWRPTV